MPLKASKKIRKYIYNSILDLLFPKACLICGKSGVFLCKRCLKEIKINSLQVCPVCEKIITENGKVCKNCQKKESFIDQMIVASDYQKSEISGIIHFYKYKFIQDLHIPLGKILLKSLIKNEIFVPDFIIPIPLHRSRLRWRGFNQSELLANYISKNLLPGIEIPVLNNLVIRTKNTPSQMKVKKYAERQKNLENAFALNKIVISTTFNSAQFKLCESELSKNKRSGKICVFKKSTYGRKYERIYAENKKNITNDFPPLRKGSLPAGKAGAREGLIFADNLKNKKFIIIDDVCTTGATVSQCAKVIKKLKPAKIAAAVLGRQK